MTAITDTEYIIDLLEEQNDMIADMQKQIDYLTRIVLGIDEDRTMRPRITRIVA